MTGIVAGKVAPLLAEALRAPHWQGGVFFFMFDIVKKSVLQHRAV